MIQTNTRVRLICFAIHGTKHTWHTIDTRVVGSCKFAKLCSDAQTSRQTRATDTQNTPKVWRILQKHSHTCPHDHILLTHCTNPTNCNSLVDLLAIYDCKSEHGLYPLTLSLMEVYGGNSPTILSTNVLISHTYQLTASITRKSLHRLYKNKLGVLLPKTDY